MDSILVATDFSGDARNAAWRAGMLARERGLAKGVLLHVLPPVPLDLELELRATAALERSLEALAAEIAAASGFAFEPRIASGAVVHALAEAAAGFSLVVLGARGVNPLRDLAIGSSAERLLRKCRRPVLIVKARPQAPYRRVIVPVDFSPDSGAALALAAALAPEAGLTLAHAYEVPFEGKLGLAGASAGDIERYRNEARWQASARMDAMLASAGLAPGRASRVLARAYAPRLIQDTAAAAGADLIAIGKHGGSMAEELLLGSVTLHTLAAAACDVLVVPGPEAAPRLGDLRRGSPPIAPRVRS